MLCVCARVCVCMCAHVCVCVLCSLSSGVQFLVTSWTVACQPPLSMKFSGKNTGVGCHALLRGSSWPRGWTRGSCISCIAGGLFTAEPLGKPPLSLHHHLKYNHHRKDLSSEMSRAVSGLSHSTSLTGQGLIHSLKKGDFKRYGIILNKASNIVINRQSINI